MSQHYIVTTYGNGVGGGVGVKHMITLIKVILDSVCNIRHNVQLYAVILCSLYVWLCMCLCVSQTNIANFRTRQNVMLLSINKYNLKIDGQFKKYDRCRNRHLRGCD